jgi:beta-lactamase regulating signal transducer with metallopeptidase domain
MNSTILSLIEPLGWTLLHFLWQGAVIALLLRGFLLMARRSAPQVRYVASGIALVMMPVAAGGTFWWLARSRIVVPESPGLVAPFSPVIASPAPPATQPPGTGVAPLPAGMPVSPTAAPGAPPMNSVSVVAASAPTLTEHLRAALPWLVGVWAAGVALFSLRLANGWCAVRRWRAAAEAGLPAEWRAKFAALCEKLHVTRPVRLLSSAALNVPVVIGWLKPIVLVPSGLLAGLPAAQLEALLAHELAHIRRHDYLVNLLQTIGETLLFYQPAVWWVSARLRCEREHCCDDIAASLNGDALTYARALTALEELRTLPTAAVSAAGGSLLTRIRRLAGLPEERASVWPVIALLAGVLSSVPWLKADEADKPVPKKIPQAAETDPLLAPITNWTPGGKTSGPEHLAADVAARLKGRRITLGGGCVEMHGLSVDGTFKFSDPQKARINTGADAVPFMFLNRPQHITHIVIEVMPGAFEISEIEAILGPDQCDVQLAFAGEPFHSANVNPDHPAGAAVDARSSTTWRPADLTKPAVAVFTLTDSLLQRSQSFSSGGVSAHQLSLGFHNHGTAPLQIRATAIAEPDAAPPGAGYPDLTPDESLTLSPEGHVLHEGRQLTPGELTVFLQGIASKQRDGLVRVHPGPAGRFVNIAPLLDAVSASGLTNMIFEPRSLQGVFDEKPHPPADELISAILAIHAKGGTPLSSLMRLLAVQGGRFDKDVFANIFKRHALRRTWTRLASQEQWTEAEAHAAMQEVYAQHPAPLVWLELAEQMRQWTAQHVVAGTRASDDRLKMLSFGPPLSNGLRAAASTPVTGSTMRSGDRTAVRFVFHNAGHAPLEFESETYRQWDHWRFTRADGTDAATGWGGIPGASFQRRFRLAPGEIVEISRPPLELNLPPGRDYRPFWTLKINNVWAPGSDLKQDDLTTGETEFHLDFADPPNTPVALATAPGRYPLAPGTTLKITRTEETGGTVKNTAIVEWHSNEAFAPPSSEVRNRHPFSLPDGTNSYRIAWPVNAGIMWVRAGNELRKIDFRNPQAVVETATGSGAAAEAGTPAGVSKELQKFPRRGSSGGSEKGSGARKTGVVFGEGERTSAQLERQTLPQTMPAPAEWTPLRLPDELKTEARVQPLKF